MGAPALSAALGLFLSTLSLVVEGVVGGSAVYAVNAGGGAHMDINGIRYRRDDNPVGVESDFGKRLEIRGCPFEDQVLYQTERYHTHNFYYDIPVEREGSFVLVLKFAEVYFRSPNQKVFNVILNEHEVLRNLDIFGRSGAVARAHDEYIPFQVTVGKKGTDKTLHIHGKKSPITGGKIRLTFAKGSADNPKINAFFLWEGSMNDVPQLRPQFFDEDDQEEEEEDVGGMDRDPGIFLRAENGHSIASGPIKSDPWESLPETTKYAPLFVSIIISSVALLCSYYSVTAK